MIFAWWREGLEILAAGVATLITLLLLRRFAVVLDLIDRPGAHKTHYHAVPAVGGIGVLAGLLAAGLLSDAREIALALVAGLAALVLIGTIDDRHGLTARTRFLAQIAAALGMCFFGDVVLRDFGELLGPGATLELGWAAVPVTVLSAVGVINAVNMIDGIDGLAGSMCALVFAALSGVALATGHATSGPLLAATSMSLLVFLAFNLRLGRKRALLFLGNGGSLAIGLLLAWELIRLSQGPARAFQPVTALWLFAVPLIDTVSVMWRRLNARRSPFRADHEHIHHLLLRAGLSVNRTVTVLAAAQLLAISAALVAEQVGIAEAWRFYAFVAVAIAYHALVARLAPRLPCMRAEDVSH